MGKIVPERMAGQIDGDFVVFRIGIRINKFWKPHKWIPAFLAGPRLTKELEETEESGLLGYETSLGIRNHVVVQYWRSFDHLREYARDSDMGHLDAWQDFNQNRSGDGDVGVWHETFLVRNNEYEAIYVNMPEYGLGDAGELVPASGTDETAAGRIGRTDGRDAPVAEDGTPIDDEPLSKNTDASERSG